MNNANVIVLARLPILADRLDEAKAPASATLLLTLNKAGCEVFYQTVQRDDPTTLVFFEVFTSREAFELHLEAEYTTAFFAGIQGTLARPPVSTLHQELEPHP